MPRGFSVRTASPLPAVRTEPGAPREGQFYTAGASWLVAQFPAPLTGRGLP
ncbi:hypothetical protein GCM10010307_74000 [Streptomyces vastus]|uniref:Uncharacterized protein n=1 Tax=Streptomyces vastus TaxID=285451 RepID=A0ABN3RQP8_9ACTN